MFNAGTPETLANMLVAKNNIKVTTKDVGRQLQSKTKHFINCFS